MSALTSMLVRDGVVPVRTIEEVIQRQVITGGDEETILLEMSAVPENVLASYLAALHKCQPASREEIMEVAPNILRLVPAEVASEHRLIPIALDDAGRLAVAVQEPLSPEHGEQLGFLIGHQLESRIACAARLWAGLARHYEVELPPRYARLVGRLSERPPGQVPQVQKVKTGAIRAPAQELPVKTGPVTRAVPFENKTMPLNPVAPAARRPRFRRNTSPGMSPMTMADIAAATDESSTHSTAASAGPAPAAYEPEPIPPSVPSQPPRPVKVVSDRPVAQGEAPHSDRPTSDPPDGERGLRRFRGPLTLAGTERLLRQARNRDQVLEVLFSFACQFFDYTALFVVQDESVDGLDAFGAGATRDEVSRMSVSLQKANVFQEARRSLAPLVVQLNRTHHDRSIAQDLRRDPNLPAFVMPISIRQRVVLMLYGDRNGEEFDLGAVMELVRLCARMSEAFEQLILRRKRGGYNRGDGPSPSRRTLKDAAARTAAATIARESQPPPASDWKPARSDTPSTDFAPSEESNVVDEDSWESVEKAPVRPVSSRPRPQKVGSSVPPPPADRRPVQLAPTPAEGVETPEPPPSAPAAPKLPSNSLLLGIPRSAPPPPATPGVGLSEDSVASMLDSSEPAPNSSAFELDVDEAARVSEPPPKLLSEPPPPDAGTYQMKHASVDVISAPATRAEGVQVAPLHAIGSPAPPPTDADVEPRARRATTKMTSTQRTLRPRAPSPLPPRPEKVQPPKSARRVQRKPSGMDIDTRSVIVDMGDDIQILVERLLKSENREAEREAVRSLLSSGEAALPELVQAFPGPLRYDRHRDTQMPRPADISPVAQALVAFGTRAAPYIGSLLSSAHPDVRYYAALIATETVDPSIMGDVAARVYDEDAGVRRVACWLLPRFSAFRGFDDVVTLLRRTVRIRGKFPKKRWQAVDALAYLRDVQCIPLLIDLLNDDDRELVEHSQRALVVLTCADVALSQRRWQSWYEKNSERHRIEWLIDGLNHGDEVIRAAAAEELQRLTQESFGFTADASKRDREKIQKSYRQWWEREGRSRLG